MGTKFIRLAVVKDKTGLPCSSIYRLMSDGEFPQNIKISERASAWLEDEVDEWVERKIAAGRKKAPTTNRQSPTETQ